MQSSAACIVRCHLEKNTHMQIHIHKNIFIHKQIYMLVINETSLERYTRNRHSCWVDGKRRGGSFTLYHVHLFSFEAHECTIWSNKFNTIKTKKRSDITRHVFQEGEGWEEREGRGQRQEPNELLLRPVPRRGSPESAEGSLKEGQASGTIWEL